MSTSNEYMLSSVKNTLRILQSFKMDKPQKGVRELAAELGIGKSSVQRILATLASEGFVNKDIETNKYQLGVSVLELNSIVLGHHDLHKEALPTIKKLVERCNETSHLVVFSNQEIVYLCKEEGKNSTQIETHPGQHHHPHCTSSGKILLAHGDPSIVEIMIEKGLSKVSVNTITNPIMFQNELAAIRKNGYAKSFGEYTPTVNSVAAPVRDYTGKVVAAINLVGPSSRMPKQRMQHFATELIQAGRIISEKLGYSYR